MDLILDCVLALLSVLAANLAFPYLQRLFSYIKDKLGDF